MIGNNIGSPIGGVINAIVDTGVGEAAGHATASAVGIGLLAGDATGAAVGHSTSLGVGASIADAFGIAGPDTATLLLLHCNGSDGSTDFVDSSVYTRAATALNNAEIDTSATKFGSGSLQCFNDGDSLSVASSADWHIWDDDATVEGWVSIDSVPAGNFILILFSSGSSTGNIWTLNLVRTSGSWSLQLLVDNEEGFSAFTAAISAPTLGVFQHYAAERHGDNANLYVNGAKQTLTFDNGWGTVAVPSLTPLIVCSVETSGLSCRGDEFRIVSGRAEYGGVNFTPPIAEYVPYGGHATAVGSISADREGVGECIADAEANGFLSADKEGDASADGHATAAGIGAFRLRPVKVIITSINTPRRDTSIGGLVAITKQNTNRRNTAIGAPVGITTQNTHRRETQVG